MLFGVLDVFLGLDPVHAWATIGLVVLAALAFTAIAHLLRTWLVARKGAAQRACRASMPTTAARTRRRSSDLLGSPDMSMS